MYLGAISDFFGVWGLQASDIFPNSEASHGYWDYRVAYEDEGLPRSTLNPKP